MKYITASFVCILFGLLWVPSGNQAAAASWLAASIVLSSLAREKSE